MGFQRGREVLPGVGLNGGGVETGGDDNKDVVGRRRGGKVQMWWGGLGRGWSD